MNRKVALIGVGILVGLLMVWQFRSYVGVEALLSRGASDQDVVNTVYTLKMANERLKEDILTLEEQLQSYSDVSLNHDNLMAEIEKNELLLGIKPISGPGLKIYIPTAMKIEDFVDLTNEWWSAGAEAMIINGHRLIERQNSFYNLNDLLLLNGEILTPPYTFDIIGDPNILEHFLLKSAYFNSFTYEKLSDITA